jgi:hypothetical protein
VDRILECAHAKRPQRRWRCRIGAAGGVTVAGADDPAASLSVAVRDSGSWPGNLSGSVRDNGFHSNFSVAIEQRCFRSDTVYQILVIVSIKIGLIAQSLFSYLTQDSLRDRQQRATMDSEAIHRAVRF